MRQWVVVVGGTNMDVVARTSAPFVAATSNPGHTRISPGGVGRNIAACLGLLGAPVRLVSAVGDDPFGDEALRVTAECGADVSGVRRAPGRTGTYTALLDSHGELVAAVSDMAIIDELELDTLPLEDVALVVVDGNLAPGQMAKVQSAAAAADIPVVLEPVSVAKAGRLWAQVQDLLLVTPNSDEIGGLVGRPDHPWAAVHDLYDRGVEHVWMREGARGSYLCTRGARARPPARHRGGRRGRHRCRRRDARRLDRRVAAWRRPGRGRPRRTPRRGRHDREPAHRPPRPGRGHGRLRTPDAERGHRC